MPSETKSTPTKRRGVSKARLYKELKEMLKAHDLGEDTSIGVVLNRLRDDIVEEATK